MIENSNRELINKLIQLLWSYTAIINQTELIILATSIIVAHLDPTSSATYESAMIPSVKFSAENALKLTYEHL